MSHRLWGACASQQGLLGAALGPDRLSLRMTGLDENPVSWGIGFYERSEPLVRKCPWEERTEIDLSGVVAETRSDLLVGHVREPTVGALVADNTHPFRFRQWLFAHDGTIAQFEAIQKQLVDAMPSFLSRSLVGVTDSECFFHLVLAFLHDARHLDNPQLGPAPVREALSKAVTMVDELASQQNGGTASPMNVLMTNGAYLLALHRSPLELRYMTYNAPSREQIRPRAVLVACEKSTAGSNWTAMPPNSILTASHDMTVEISELLIPLLVISLVAALVALVLASQLPHPGWVWALKGLALAGAVALWTAGDLVVNQLRGARRLRPWLWPTVSVVVALALRPWLVEYLEPPERVPRLDYWRLQLGSLAAVAALFALAGALRAVQRHGSWYHLAGAGSMMAVAFFVMGPVFQSWGLPLDHRTFVGLVGLGLGAFAVMEAGRRFGAK